MLLKSDVSCSSVHASEVKLPLPASALTAAGVSNSASPGDVDAALEGWRAFFLGGMAKESRIIKTNFNVWDTGI